MKYLLILLVALNLGLPAWSQESPQEKVAKAANGLFPPGHRVLIADEKQWDILSQRLHLKTDHAFTNMEHHLTILRIRFIDVAPPTELRRALAHEAGHVRCDCYSEELAEAWADTHL